MFRPFLKFNSAILLGGHFSALQCVGGSLSRRSFEAMRSPDLSPFFFNVCVCVISYWPPQSVLMFAASRMRPLTNVTFLSH